MKAYMSIWRLRFLNGLQYRSAAYAGIATQFFFGMIGIMILVAFYDQPLANPPAIRLEQLVSYIWLQQAFLAFIMLWYRDNEIFQLITSGNIAYELCRPCGIYEFWYAKLLAQRLAAALLRCSPILAVAFFLPDTYRLHTPPTWTAFLLFSAALLLGLLVLVAVSMMIYISVFWTMSPVGSMLMIGVIGEFFAGMVIPVPLMPGWLQQIAYILPFRWTADFPFRIYSGNIPAGEALWGIIVQLIWLTILVAAGKAAMGKALRQVTVQGG